VLVVRSLLKPYKTLNPVSPEDLDDEVRINEEEGAFEEVIKQHLLSAGIKNGRKDEMVVFRSVELLSHSYLHAEGFYMNGVGEKKGLFPYRA
jgi:adenine-specific DNA-methyltransferase